MLKTHKIALDPNNVQATQFAQHCGYARVAYNHALADFKAGLAKGDWRSHIDLQHRFNAVKYDKYPWAKDMSQTVSKCAIYNNLKDAIGRWCGRRYQALGGHVRRGVLRESESLKALRAQAKTVATSVEPKAERRS